jgi:hypothetical protein
MATKPLRAPGKAPLEDDATGSLAFHATSPAVQPQPAQPIAPSSLQGFHAAMQQDFATVLRLPQERVSWHSQGGQGKRGGHVRPWLVRLRMGRLGGGHACALPCAALQSAERAGRLPTLAALLRLCRHPAQAQAHPRAPQPPNHTHTHTTPRHTAPALAQITAATHNLACPHCRQGLAAALARVQQQQQQQGASAPPFLLAGVPWRMTCSGKSGSLMLAATAAPSLAVLRELLGSSAAPPVPRALPPLAALHHLAPTLPPASARLDFLEDAKGRLLTAMKSLVNARQNLRALVE